MTVAELIGILQGKPMDLRVMVDGYEGGLADLVEANIHQVQASIDAYKDSGYYGPHEAVFDGNPDAVIEPALVLGRDPYV